MNSARMAPGPSGADLADADEAVAYLQNAQLRSGLLAALNAVDCAMSAAGPKAPWQVLDRGFGRAADGEWVGGPVDSYKVWCSATLFAAVAHKLTPPDAEVRAAAVGVLRHFKGDVVYTSGGRGTAGGPTSTRYVLGPAPDEGTLALVGGVQWSDIIAATPTQPPACGAGAPPPPAIEPSPAPEPERDTPTPQAREGDLPPRLAPPCRRRARRRSRRRGLLPPPQAVPSSPSCSVPCCCVPCAAAVRGAGRGSCRVRAPTASRSPIYRRKKIIFFFIHHTQKKAHCGFTSVMLPAWTCTSRHPAPHLIPASRITDHDHLRGKTSACSTRSRVGQRHGARGRRGGSGGRRRRGLLWPRPPPPLHLDPLVARHTRSRIHI